MNKAKFLYFTVFVLVVFAFVFHITAMGFHHWKVAVYPKSRNLSTVSVTSFGLFTRCSTSNASRGYGCEPNRFPEQEQQGQGQGQQFCSYTICSARRENDVCPCDYLPSSKGIAACAIIAAVFLGLALILLFIQSINEANESRLIAIFFGFIPLLLLLLTWLFILITLILVGSYLARDVMFMMRLPNQSNASPSPSRSNRDDSF